MRKTLHACGRSAGARSRLRRTVVDDGLPSEGRGIRREIIGGAPVERNAELQRSKSVMHLKDDNAIVQIRGTETRTIEREPRSDFETVILDSPGQGSGNNDFEQEVEQCA